MRESGLRPREASQSGVRGSPGSKGNRAARVGFREDCPCPESASSSPPAARPRGHCGAGGGPGGLGCAGASGLGSALGGLRVAGVCCRRPPLKPQYLDGLHLLCAFLLSKNRLKPDGSAGAAGGAREQVQKTTREGDPCASPAPGGRPLGWGDAGRTGRTLCTSPNTRAVRARPRLARVIGLSPRSETAFSGTPWNRVLLSVQNLGTTGVRTGD